MGFRDSNQDLLGFVHLVPERARERILDIAATQFPDGSAYHQYQPLSKRGNNDVGSRFNDDPLWLIEDVSAYVKETGDFSILDTTVPFDNDPDNVGSLFEHLRRSFHHVLEYRGPHGLPLIGRADWNDCLNLNCFSETPGESFQTTENRSGGVAESVFTAGLFVHCAPDYAALADEVGDVHEVHRMEPYVYAQMIAGKDAVRHGEAKNSRLTGTAAWNFVAISQHILGVKPEFEGLRVEPCLPAELTTLEITRRCRGASTASR